MSERNRTNGYKALFTLIGMGQKTCGICGESLTEEIKEYLEFFTRKYLKRSHCDKCSTVYRGDRKRINMNIDHLVPLGVGGRNVYSNMHLAHRTCNDQKGSTIS